MTPEWKKPRMQNLDQRVTPALSTEIYIELMKMLQVD